MILDIFSRMLCSNQNNEIPSFVLDTLCLLTIKSLCFYMSNILKTQPQEPQPIFSIMLYLKPKFNSKFQLFFAQQKLQGFCMELLSMEYGEDIKVSNQLLIDQIIIIMSENSKQEDIHQHQKHTTSPPISLLEEKQESLNIKQVKQQRLQPSIIAQQKHLKLKLITWNLMGSLPPQQSVNKLLNKQSLETIDILIIATQQCQRTLLASFFNDSKQTWELMVFESLHQLKFVRIESNILQGLHLIVFVGQKHYKNVKNIETKVFKCGFYGLTGNKGATSIEFQIYSHSVCIINVHLAAGHNEIQERNLSLLEIRDLLTPKYKQDTCFIIGDMNYRIDTNEEEVIKINQSEFKSLNSYVIKDQMLSQKQLKLFFEEYHEGTIDFPPTYKMELNRNKYVQNRVPGWTDRIFYRVDRNLEMVRYWCQHDIFGSDHRPVIGQFKLKVRSQKGDRKKRLKEKRDIQNIEKKNQDDCLLF